MNSLNLYLSAKLFISQSVMMRSLLGNFCCRLFPFSNLNISCHFLLACRVSAERSVVKCMGFSLYVACCFSLVAFNILSLCLIFVSLINMCLVCFPLGLSCKDSLCLLDLMDYFLLHVGKIFKCNLFENFLIHLLFLFFFWDPNNLNVGAFVISQKSLRQSLIIFILFTLFCFSEVISTILYSSSLIHSST